MVRLNNPNRRILTLEDFEKYPVWTWDDENEGHLPLTEMDPAPEEYGGLFIKAEFILPNDRKFPGYLVGDYYFHAFCFFVYSEKIMFNVNLPDFFEKKLSQLFSLLKCEPFTIFPLRYNSPVHYKDGGGISGVFELKNGKLTCIPADKEERDRKIRAELEKRYGKF